MDGIRNIWTWNVNKLCRAVISGAVVASNVCDTVVVRLWAHVREHSPQGKYYCMAGILFDWFGFSSLGKHIQITYFLVCSIPVQLIWRDKPYSDHSPYSEHSLLNVFA